MGKLNMIDGYGMSEQSFHNHPERLHETSLIWKVGHPDLDKNKAGSLCLKSVLGKLKKDPKKFDSMATSSKINSQKESSKG